MTSFDFSGLFESMNCDQKIYKYKFYIKTRIEVVVLDQNLDSNLSRARVSWDSLSLDVSRSKPNLVERSLASSCSLPISRISLN